MISHLSIGRWALSALMMIVAIRGSAVLAEEVAAAKEPASEQKPSEKPSEKPAEKADERFAVPKDATAKEMLAFLRKVRRQQIKSADEMKQLLAAIEQGSDAILSAKDADDEATLAAVRFKFMVYNTRSEYLDDEAAAKSAKKFAESLVKHAQEEIREIAADELLKSRVANLGEMAADERKELLNDVVARLQKNGLDREAYQLAMSFGEAYEDAAEPDEAAEAYETFAKVFAASKDSQVVRNSEKLFGIARRLRLPGNPIDVEGATLDGKPFDWKAYRGKVVLVDYWATWCGPCIRELPNVKANYEKYHGKGFEVVGISLDEDQEALEEFIKKREIPWVTLYGKDEATRGWDHPMAAKYGITGIPTVILVDKEGKVVSLNARGPALGKLLEKLLGPVEDEKKPAETKE